MRRFSATALYSLGESVEIINSGITGTVVEAHLSRSGNSYDVQYTDRSGNPQERRWRESQLYPAGSDTECTAHAMALCEDEDLSNIIRFPARYAGAA